MAKKSTIVRIIRTAAPALSRIAPPLAARWLERLFLTPARRPVRPDERELMDAATRWSIRFDDTRLLPLYAWGQGPTALLVHGWSGRGSQLAGYVAPLVFRGYRVVTFDAPGHGDADGRRSSLPELAQVVERVADHLGPVDAIIAHSLGTAATTIAVARGIAAERLVYVAPPENLSGYLERLAGFLGFTPAIAARTRARIERRYQLPFEQARGAALAPTMRAPLLVVHDADDREVPHHEGQDLVDAWPGARLITTRGLGHNRILRAPAVVRAAVDFVAADRDAARAPYSHLRPIQNLSSSLTSPSVLTAAICTD